ncbi:MAG: CCA tRNA nucleotidyltransferase [Deltaproteobacteria bacterium]|nr:CCA tRNA nucleotidyltransferase [Deltaproteobacteria bacterium]
MALFTPEQLSVFRAIESTARSADMRVCVVGGVVRDICLLHAATDKDIDFLVEGDAIAFAELLARQLGGVVKKFPDFVTAKILSPQAGSSIAELDFASARSETYAIPGALPQVALTSIESDLKRRDFTINAMAVPVAALLRIAELPESDVVGALQADLIDCFGGLKDLETRRIKILHPKSFLDDPTRIFRAARYAARLDGVLDRDTESCLRSAVSAGALASISEHRKINEINKVLAEEQVCAVLELLQRWDILSRIAVLAHVPLQKLLKSLSALTNSSYRAEKINRQAVFLALAALLTSQDSLEAFSKIGISKKRIEEFSRARKWISTGIAAAELNTVSDAVLVACSLVSDQPGWTEALLERGVRNSV